MIKIKTNNGPTAALGKFRKLRKKIMTSRDIYLDKRLFPNKKPALRPPGHRGFFFSPVISIVDSRVTVSRRSRG
jgi:hypothetical protein